VTDVLAALDPTVAYVMEPEPGWVWARCPICHQCRYQRRPGAKARCRMTPKCEGVMTVYLVLTCIRCG
jgi:hypothetical protein